MSAHKGSCLSSLSISYLLVLKRIFCLKIVKATYRIKRERERRESESGTEMHLSLALLTSVSQLAEGARQHAQLRIWDVAHLRNEFKPVKSSDEILKWIC